jgi:hypothetical protein
MRFLVRWAFRLFILLLVLAVALVLLKDILAKAFLEHQIRAQSGMEAKVGTVDLGLFSPTITVEDLKLFNRAEFGGSPLLDIPDLHVEYDLAVLARRRLRLRLVRLSLAEMNIVEAKDGRTNVVLGVDLGANGPGSQGRQVLGLGFAGIDTLNLTVGKIRYTSLRRPENTAEVKVGLRNEIYTNVRSLADLGDLLLRSSFRNGITITTKAPQPRSAAGGGKSGRKVP